MSTAKRELPSILVVADDPAVRRVLEEALEPLGGVEAIGSPGLAHTARYVDASVVLLVLERDPIDASEKRLESAAALPAWSRGIL